MVDEAEIDFSHAAAHGHMAVRPRRHVVFLDKPHKLYPKGLIDKFDIKI